LGLNTAAVDGTTVILQLPPVLPALTLQEAASRRTASTHVPAEAGRPFAAKLSGPEVLHTLPKGKVSSFFTPNHPIIFNILWFGQPRGSHGDVMSVVILRKHNMC
jgi:hypothetical protein